jgi:Tfp pilus assembly protein PilF
MRNGTRRSTLCACGSAVLALGLALPAAARPPAPPDPAAPSSEPAGEPARELLAEGRVAEAISWLKTAIEQNPSEAPLHWLLARAYLLDGNELWALRSLGRLVELSPEDCRPRLWIAWIQIRQGLTDAAEESLATAACEPGTPDEARHTLLAAMVASRRGTHQESRALFERARRADAVYAEDRVALRRLAPQMAPGYVPPLSARFDLETGWTSNARAGSPRDPATGVAEVASPFGQASAWLRWVKARPSFVRPALEVQGQALGFLAERARDYSYVTLGARPGLLLGQRATSLLVAYRFETLLLERTNVYDPGPLWFYHAHRGELELDLSGRVMMFAGAGRRTYRESVRSRTELDGGIGASLELGDRGALLAALTGRWHDTEDGPYDLRGGSLLASTELRLPKRWSARIDLLASLDDYPHSAGYFDPLAGPVRRRDRLLKVAATGFAPALRSGLRLGLGYEYAQRFSTTDPYDYRDHRLLLKLVWPLSRDPSLPRSVTPEGHVPLEYGLSEARLEERIQDLLRQDEELRGCSLCVE